MIQKIAWLALAGAMGTLARYGLVGLVQRFTSASFPWGTLAVNIAGCLLAGLLWALFESKWPLAGETRIIILVGFMGAFTTFSTFILESSELARTAEWMHAAGNVLLHNSLGFVALFLGVALGRWV